jgi:hypothetical protein
MVKIAMPSPNTSDGQEDAAFGDDHPGQRADGVADSGGGEQHAERGQHLRQHRRPADRVDQPPAFLQRGDRRRPQPGEDGASASSTPRPRKT